MRIIRWLVVIAVVFCALSAAPAARAQYVGGQAPPNGPTDNGAPTQVLGQQFEQQPPANAVVPITKSKSSDANILGPLTLGDVIAGAAIIGALGLLWFLFAWRRRRDEDEEEGLAAPA
jgi:hypothetical protein